MTGSGLCDVIVGPEFKMMLSAAWAMKLLALKATMRTACVRRV